MDRSSGVLSCDRLPCIAELRCRAQALAMLDAIVCPDWELRYYSYNAAWGSGAQMASQRNGQGDEWFLLLDSAGAAIKGLNHESPVARGDAFPEAIQRTVPARFAAFLSEDAFSMTEASFCYWRGTDDERWSKVDHPNPQLSGVDDGSAAALALLVGTSADYQQWAQDYFDVEVPTIAVDAIYARAPLDAALVRSVMSNAEREQVTSDAQEIGYPIAVGY